MPQALTDLERRALDYIVEYLRENTYQPSIREIGRRFGLKSTKTVSELLHSIESKGYIERDPSRSRGVRLLGVTLRSATASVPVMGPDGTPIDRLELDRRIAGPAGCYLQAMAGQDLRGDGICDGDLLLIEPVGGVVLENGDIVVMEDSGSRRFTRTNGASSNSACGRVIACLRLLRSPREPSLPGDAH
jgi:repressor LexA